MYNDAADTQNGQTLMLLLLLLLQLLLFLCAAAAAAGIHCVGALSLYVRVFRSTTQKRGFTPDDDGSIIRHTHTFAD